MAVRFLVQIMLFKRDIGINFWINSQVYNDIWVILRKTAYFSNEILKEKNRYFLSGFHGNLFYICSRSHF